MSERIRVTVWGENVHERENPLVAKIYPDGMHHTIADAISEDGDCKVRTATLQEPEHGLATGVLESTDVLIWWGHDAYPIYYNKSVRLVLRNAVRWAAGDGVKWIDSCPQISAKDAPEPLEIKGPKIHKEGEAGFR